MLELIGIFTLAREIKRIISEKGLKPYKYILLMVVLWLGFETIGLFIGMILFGSGIYTYLMAFPGAAIGAILGYQIAKNASPVEEQYSIDDFGKDVKEWKS